MRLSETIKCFREINNTRMCCGPFKCSGTLMVADSCCTFSYKTHIRLLTPSSLRQTLLCPHVFLFRKLHKSESKAWFFSVFTQVHNHQNCSRHGEFVSTAHSPIFHALELRNKWKFQFSLFFHHFALLSLELRPSNISQVHVHVIITVLVASDSLIRI